jgi:hypothetical protein
MVEIIPKETQETSKEVSLSFYFIISLLVFSVGCYFVLNHLLNKAEQELTFLEAGLAEMVTLEKRTREREVLILESKINNFAVLTSRHLEVSDVFKLFEEYSHPQVWFVKINLSADKKQVQVFGEAQSFEALGQQIFIFEDNDLFETTRLEDVSINRQGRIDFSLSVSFKNQVFQPKFLETKPSLLEQEIETELDLIQSEIDQDLSENNLSDDLLPEDF